MQLPLVVKVLREASALMRISSIYIFVCVCVFYGSFFALFLCFFCLIFFLISYIVYYKCDCLCIQKYGWGYSFIQLLYISHGNVCFQNVSQEMELGPLYITSYNVQLYYH